MDRAGRKSREIKAAEVLANCRFDNSRRGNSNEVQVITGEFRLKYGYVGCNNRRVTTDSGPTHPELVDHRLGG